MHTKPGWKRKSNGTHGPSVLRKHKVHFRLRLQKFIDVIFAPLILMPAGEDSFAILPIIRTRLSLELAWEVVGLHRR